MVSAAIAACVGHALHWRLHFRLRQWHSPFGSLSWIAWLMYIINIHIMRSPYASDWHNMHRVASLFGQVPFHMYTQDSTKHYQVNLKLTINCFRLSTKHTMSVVDFEFRCFCPSVMTVLSFDCDVLTLSPCVFALSDMCCATVI